MSTAYEDGNKAFNAGLPRDGNPYPRGSWERAEWFLGYDIG